MELTFADHGAVRLYGAAAPFMSDTEDAFANLPPDQAGIRLHGIQGLAELLSSNALGSYPASVLGSRSKPVRAILFDKSEATNWALGWHQDRTIAVAGRFDIPDYGPWSTKSGMTHVEPPFDLIERMVTIRVHLDPVDADNAPLTVAPGSHRLGRILESSVEQTVARCGTALCLANRGDIWLYSTSILHASGSAKKARHRRVLQVDFSADDLPKPLMWLGV